MSSDPDVVSADTVSADNNNSEDGVSSSLLKNEGIFSFKGYRLPPESDLSNEAASGDIDGDEDEDIIIANTGQNMVYLNDGNGRFINADDPFSGDNDISMDVILFDADGDKDLDIFFANDSTHNRLYLNDGSGGFRDVTSERLPLEGGGGDPSRGVDAGDIDGDGDIDIVVANHNIQIRLYVNRGDGYFEDRGDMIPDARYYTNTVKMADIDNDMDLDIAVGNRGENRLYINDGKGNFSDETDDRLPSDNDDTISITVSDIDGRNGMDMIIGNKNSSLRVYMNDGTGRFHTASNSITNSIIEINDMESADIDMDGDMDLIAATQDKNRIFINNGGLFNEESGHITAVSEPGRGVAILDADGDGAIDMVFANYDQQNRIYINDGRGFFSDVTMFDTPPDYDRNLDVMIGDLDNDGDLDIVVPDFGRDKLYMNDGKGRFRDVSETNMPWDGDEDEDISCDATLGDLDNDGYLDIFLTNFNAQQDRLLLNNGDGSFRDVTDKNFPRDNNSSHDAEMGDIDNDGDIDIVVPNDLGGPTSIFLNDGEARFADVTDTVINNAGDDSFAGRLGDFDGDGDLDIVVANSRERARLYLNRINENGRLLFEDVTDDHLPDDSGDDSRDVSIGDIDGDGDLDMITGNFGQRTRLYINDGMAYFSDVTETHLPDNTGDITERAQIADVDADGDLDIFLSNEQQNRLFLNNGEGEFTDVTETHLPEDTDLSTGSDVGDLDGDGYPDIVVSNQGQQNRIYFNTGIAK